MEAILLGDFPFFADTLQAEGAGRVPARALEAAGSGPVRPCPVARLKCSARSLDKGTCVRFPHTHAARG